MMYNHPMWYVGYVLLLFCIACSDYTIGQQEPVNPLLSEDVQDVTVILFLDNSGSMRGDWPLLTYGITRIPSDLDAAGVSWRLFLTSTTPEDPALFELTSDPLVDSGWQMAQLLDTFHQQAEEGEAGFAAALALFRARPELTEIQTNWILLFISDEPEQSNIPPEEFLVQLPLTERWIVSIVDTGEVVSIGSGRICGSGDSDSYLAVANRSINLCALQPWSLMDAR